MTIKSSGSGGETVTVVAPATLTAGYTFDAVVEDGRTIAVTVPPGGVKMGQTFEAIVASPLASDPEIAVVPVPLDDATGSEIASTTTKTVVRNPDGTRTVTEETAYPDGRVTTAVSTLPAGSAVSIPAGANPVKAGQQPARAADVPTGQWRYDLFSCFDACGSGMFWMAWCCTYVALGQLLQRLKMNACGRPGGDYKNTCTIWTVVWALAIALYGIIVGVTEGYGIFVYYALGIFALIAMTNARNWMRTKWRIPADCCGEGCIGDCCCVFWCGCCSLIQMMRHTHDDRVDYYSCGSATGLEPGAPEVV